MRRLITGALVIPLVGLGALLATGPLRSVSAGSAVGAPVRQATTNHTLTVTGTGSINVKPDMARLSLGVETRASDAQAASTANASAMTAVINAVEAQGVPANKIRTSVVSINFDEQKAVYVADNQVTVTIDDVSKVGAVLDAGVKAGANRSWGIDFGLQDQTAADAQALQAAIKNARSRADTMATALGVTITGVGSAQASSYTTPPVPYAAPVRAPASSASTPVVAGDIPIQATVTVVYTF